MVTRRASLESGTRPGTGEVDIRALSLEPWSDFDHDEDSFIVESAENRGICNLAAVIVSRYPWFGVVVLWSGDGRTECGQRWSCQHDFHERINVKKNKYDASWDQLLD